MVILEWVMVTACNENGDGEFEIGCGISDDVDCVNIASVLGSSVVECLSFAAIIGKLYC